MSRASGDGVAGPASAGATGPPDESAAAAERGAT